MNRQFEDRNGVNGFFAFFSFSFNFSGEVCLYGS
jgi:hypothetical protein